MDIFSVLSLFGGLALFLFGMQYMGSGLEKASGGKLEKLLEKMTDNPIKGVLLGVAVTAVIQSSSATTVMVVGFVNSGIMKLGQAVGVLQGAKRRNDGHGVDTLAVGHTGRLSRHAYAQAGVLLAGDSAHRRRHDHDVQERQEARDRLDTRRLRDTHVRYERDVLGGQAARGYA